MVNSERKMKVGLVGAGFRGKADSLKGTIYYSSHRQSLLSHEIKVGD